jgi:hypothetical protein
MSPDLDKHRSECAPARFRLVSRATGRRRHASLSGAHLRLTVWGVVCVGTLAGFGSWMTAWSAPPTTRQQESAASSNPRARRSTAQAARSSAGKPQTTKPSAAKSQGARPSAAKPAKPSHGDGELAAIIARLESSSPRSRQSVAAGTPARLTATDPVSESDLSVLQEKIHRVLTLYFPKHQNTRDNNAWEVMHEIIAYGVDAQLFRDGPSGPKVNAIGWLCYNGSCKGEQMLYLDRGQLVARKGPGVQGHYGQFLAILAQSRLPMDYPMLISGKKFTIADLVQHEQSDCQPGEELTFKLIGLMHYLDSDATWTSRDGQAWSIPRLITEELKQPIRGAACGGTHRLMGFSYAVNKRIQRGKPVTGEFARAQKFINEYHRYTFSLQNSDGSFSTQWFTRREADPDVDRRLKTTGHITEWLAFSLSDDEVRSPAMVKAVDYLATILLADRNRSWEIGPLGHGLHALALYDRRLSLAQRPVESLVTRLPKVTDEIVPPLDYLPGDIVADDPAARAADATCLHGVPAIEVANKPRWEMPPCEIGNDSESVPCAPDAAIPPGDADDKMCL